MKKQFLLLALAGSIFVSQPVKAVPSTEREMMGVATSVVAVYFFYETLSNIWERIKSGNVSFDRNLEIALLGCAGVMFGTMGHAILSE